MALHPPAAEEPRRELSVLRVARRAAPAPAHATGDRFGGGRCGRTDGFHALGRHAARPGLRLQDQHLHPAPQLVLVRLAPDSPHLGQRVPLDHASTLSGTASRCSMASAAATIRVSSAISAATLSATPTAEAASASAAAPSR